MRVRTNAKVNLFLRVLGKRPDGYHDIETVYQSVGLADELEFFDAPAPEIELEIDDSRVGSAPIPDADNLIRRAAELLQRRHRPQRGVRIRARKTIPVGAGLAGGSANAAGALVALNQLWGAELMRPQLMTMAATLGSDVPFCISGGTALGTGRGERIAPLGPSPPLWFVLGVSEEPLATERVYRTWRGRDPMSADTSAALARALRGGDAAAVASFVHNDLEAPAVALRPDLEHKKRALLDAGALGAAVAGSGPTLFGVVANRDHADAVAREVKGVFDRVEVAASRPRCVEQVV